jgi:ribA/ribD-fused uncharacterized protein
MSAEELKRFYKARVKKPDLYTYDDDGNLVELNKEGAVVKTIPLPDYRVPSYEEFDEMEQKRITAIALANKEYEDARKELREMLSRPDVLESEVLRINRKVKEADIKLLSVRFPLRYVSIESGIEIKEIDFSKSYEKRKYPYDFFFLEERPFTLQEQYVRIGKAPVKPTISVAEAKAAVEAANSQIVILFADPETNDYGFLSLKWTVELEINGTMYNSAYQALAAELAKGFNDQTGLQKIMLAESPDEINYKLENVPGEAETNETKWNDLTKQLIYDINIAKFNQYPELSARLLETKNAILGAYIPNDNLIGIGISIDNVQSKDPINWTGQNILGKALMDIRQKIQTEREAVAQQEAALAAQSKPKTGRKRPQVADRIVPPPSAIVAPSETPVGVPRPIRRQPVMPEEVVAEQTVTTQPPIEQVTEETLTEE